jgi:hypothetical protein
MRADLLAPLIALALASCTRTHELATSDLDGGISDGAIAPVIDADVVTEGGVEGGIAVTYDAGIAYCGARPCACSNGIDDDGDGRADGFDFECTGAFDDVEADFATGVADESVVAKCQDCYFDVVPGRDACNRATSCALNGSPSGGTGACRTCEVSDACSDHCARLAPNGCDCFGCCQVYRDGQQLAILLRPGCSMDDLSDLARCPRCIPAPDCQNPCDACELCPGRTLADLPPTCGGQFDCSGSSPCVDSGDCGSAQYCQSGCCLDTLI